MKRLFTLTLKPDTGNINMFYAFINGKRVIAHEGSIAKVWKGEIGEEQLNLKVRVTGKGNSTYMVKIDLPGTVNEQKITFQLSGGYHEFDWVF